MRKSLDYSTKYIDKKLERDQMLWDKAKQEIQDGEHFEKMMFQRLDQEIAEQKYDWIIDSLSHLFFCYAGNGDRYLQLDADTKKAKENYYIAASVGVLCYEMIEKGFSHHISDSGYPYDFKKKNFNYSKVAILANESELALKMTGDDTVEGALILQDYERACTILPENPEDEFLCKDEIRQCMWAIAHGDEKLFNKYMEKRIKTLRRYARLSPMSFDSWGLAVVKLASQREMSCDLNVRELPQQLLDDIKIDTSGLIFPRTEQIRDIINKKGIL